jgi:hypothetical protein
MSFLDKKSEVLAQQKKLELKDELTKDWLQIHKQRCSRVNNQAVAICKII